MVAVEVWTVRHNGLWVGDAATYLSALGIVLDRQPFSAHYAVTYDGWSIVDDEGVHEADRKDMLA